jgi:hypothetical protein
MVILTFKTRKNHSETESTAPMETAVPLTQTPPKTIIDSFRLLSLTLLQIRQKAMRERDTSILQV